MYECLYRMQENFGSKKLWQINLTGSLVEKTLSSLQYTMTTQESHMNKDSSLKNTCIAMHANKMYKGL